MKKLYALLLSGVILVTSVPISSFAAMSSDTMSGEVAVAPGTTVAEVVPISIREDYPMGGVSKQPDTKALESAIKAVKAKITIPADYSEFDYYFYNTTSYADSYWSLSWRNPGTGSQIRVNCDQDNHIVSYSKYDYNDYNNSSIPVYLKKELQGKANDFIKQIAPSITSKLEFVEATYDGIYSGNYQYRYTRKENGVIFPDNSVSVTVNSVTGEVRSASINWLYDTVVPTAEVKLTKDEAAKLIKENMKMNLVYRSNYYRIMENGEYVQKAYLVYEPSRFYISVDAKTGEVYLTRNEWVELPSDMNGTKGADEAEAEAAAGEQQLTEEEIKKIEELKNLISKEEAINAVLNNKYLYIDKSLKAYTATLSKSYGSKDADNYIWNVNLSDPREIDYTKEKDFYRGYASAQVDAKTGKILSFHASIKSQYDEVTGKWNSVKIPYDREEGRVLLEKFLDSQVKTRFTNSKLVESNNDYIVYYKEDSTPVYGGYYYQYNRVNEGIEYPYNGIYGSVDGVTGKIYSFNCNWNDNVVFESPKNAMSAEKALEKYLSKEGFELKYEINVIETYDPNVIKDDVYVDYSEAVTVDYEIRLVYRPDINPYYISPFSGDQLNYNGEVYKEEKPYAYLDIPDTEEYREIRLLTDMNIGFEGEYFNPNSKITVSEFDELMQKIGYGYGYSTGSSVKSDKFITNEELAYSFISKLGLGKMAALEGIYKTGFLDEYDINPNYIGAVALAKALGLMEGTNMSLFYPKNEVSRKDAVHLILTYINVQQKGVLY
ncbi:MAG: hypothetical protein K0S76_1215 [Herbinix sp.]|jgi:hypothetical protein|nr:hypothetical protein [Herbinix sp.]